MMGRSICHKDSTPCFLLRRCCAATDLLQLTQRLRLWRHTLGYDYNAALLLRKVPTLQGNRKCGLPFLRLNGRYRMPHAAAEVVDGPDAEESANHKRHLAIDGGDEGGADERYE